MTGPAPWWAVSTEDADLVFAAMLHELPPLPPGSPGGFLHHRTPEEHPMSMDTADEIAAAKRGGTTESHQTLTVNLPRRVIHDLDDRAAYLDVTRADMLRRVIEAGLQAMAPSPVATTPGFVAHGTVGPHSRACGIGQHPHGRTCAADCPTCQGKVWRGGGEARITPVTGVLATGGDVAPGRGIPD